MKVTPPHFPILHVFTTFVSKILGAENFRFPVLREEKVNKCPDVTAFVDEF